MTSTKHEYVGHSDDMRCVDCGATADDQDKPCPGFKPEKNRDQSESLPPEITEELVEKMCEAFWDNRAPRYQWRFEAEKDKAFCREDMRSALLILVKELKL